MLDASMFDYDRSAPLDVQVVGREERGGVVVRDITFASPAGARVPAYFVTPPAGEGAPSPSHPGILWVHWFEPEDASSNRSQFLDEALILAREGVASMLPDAFWSTTPARWVANPRFEWRTEFEHDRDLSIRQVNEIRRALDLLLQQPGVDAGRIAYVGHDFGAMYGAVMAGFDHRVQHYVLMAGTYSFSDWFTFGSQLTPEDQKAYIQQMAILDPTRWVAHAAPARLYFQFGHADYYVPERAARVFYDAASEPKEIAWYEAQHSLKGLNDQSGRDRLAWLRRALGLAAGQGGVA
jgi:dienelactone hydrolase